MPGGHPIIQTTDLETTFASLRGRDPLKAEQYKIDYSRDYKEIPKTNYGPTTVADTGSWGNGNAGMMRTANVGGAPNLIYGQPQWFSPVHTPINWQIPSKRLEQYQWARFFYENEPKVAASIDFYSFFPISDFENECSDRQVKKHFDKLKKKLNLIKWLRLMSHEIHLLGDCFPLIEISCEHCQGSGRIGEEICDHPGGSVRRIIILNPDHVEVFTTPINPDPIIALKPNEELINMVQKKLPGYERLTPEVVSLITSGQPIRLDNNNVDHLMYGEGGYTKYGCGMVRRLFPVLSYKTKLMVAQWIVAERLIVPIKIVKVGSDERPAGPADIASVQAQLAATANDPNLTIVTHHAFELDWVGASGKVLALSNEFEHINQEILDGMMINNALLNGEGPNFSSAAVGIEAMIQRLKSFRKELSRWVEEKIYIPEAKRQGFINEDAEEEEDQYIVPKIKWEPMNLRDEQQYRSFIIQLYDKGLVSGQTVLEVFDIDPDSEIERKREDAVQMAALGEGMGAAGLGAPGGPAGGEGFGGGGGAPMGDLGGGGAPMGDLGGMPGGGGEPPIGPPGGGGEMGAPAMASNSNQIVANVQDYGGKVLKKKNRERIDQQHKSVYKENKFVPPDATTSIRDSKGRIMFTKNERRLMSKLAEYKSNKVIRYPIVPQFEVDLGGQPLLLDFALPHLKIGIEADGEAFHSSDQQVARDKQRDEKLGNAGWTILRFTDKEIDKRVDQVMSTIIKSIMEKELAVKNAEKEISS